MIFNGAQIAATGTDATPIRHRGDIYTNEIPILKLYGFGRGF